MNENTAGFGAAYKVLSVRTSEDTRAQLEVLAQLNERSVTEETRIALEHWVEKSKSDPAVLKRAEQVRAEIERDALAAVDQILHRARMRVRQIHDVDEVAHAGAVARLVIGAEHLEASAAAERRRSCRVSKRRSRIRPQIPKAANGRLLSTSIAKGRPRQVKRGASSIVT